MTKHRQHGASHPLPGGRGCLYGLEGPRVIDSTEPMAYSPAALERSRMARGAFKGQWEQDVTLDRRCGTYSYTDARAI